MPPRAQRTRKAAPVPRNTKTPRRAEEVVACAVEIFNERGYAATSVGDIADALGILKGSLYYYIESKEDLLFNIVGEVHEASREIVEDALAREDLHARDRLALYVRNQTRYNALNVARVAVYYSDVNQLSEPRLKDIRSRQRTHFHALVKLITEAQEEGLIAADMDPMLAAHAVLSTVIWVYTWFRRSRAVSADQLADFCVRYTLSGLQGTAMPGLSIPVGDMNGEPAQTSSSLANLDGSRAVKTSARSA